MLKRAALALLLLSACSPETRAPTQEAQAPTAVVPVDPDAPAVAAQGDVVVSPETSKAVAAGHIVVARPTPGARVRSPLIIEGTAPNTWFFEGQFEAKLLIDGKVVIEAPAMQAGATSWTDPGPVDFRAEMNFQVGEQKEAELVLSEDMPPPENPGSDVNGPAKSIRISITLLPSSR